jgi:5-methyltetrahydrofolate--homocysteine methyltransferase
MQTVSEDLVQAISKAVMEGEDETAADLVREALETGLSPLDILHKGIVDGITETGERWKRNEFFLPDVILAADAFKAAMATLKPRLGEGEGLHRGKKVVIGVVEGDVHDLGKGMVVAMLASAGFEVIDLGIDVSLREFIAAVQEHQPYILGLGAYMTTTMLQMKEVVARLDEEGLRDDLKVMIGGVPTSQEFADEVGADAWGKDALDALHKAVAL